MSGRDFDAVQLRKHESGLRTQELTGPEARTLEAHTVALPPLCPISGNPRQGSTFALSYRPVGWVLEVYSLAQVVKRFEGGWRGTERYPAERNMEGTIRLLAQMCADALGVPVKARATLTLDAGEMVVRVRALPCAST